MSSNWPNWLPIRKDLATLTPYGAPQVDAKVRLNTNENPYSLSNELQASLTDAIKRELADLNRYPDRDAIKLRTDLADSLNDETGLTLDSSWIWAANGSNEIIQSILLAFEGAALGFEPSYSMHPLITKVVGKKWLSIARTAKYEVTKNEIELAIRADEAKIVFLTTPNNPTGNLTDISLIEMLAKGLMSRGALLVVDEAYAEFSSQASAITILNKYPNLLVSRTMSKAFAFAGARLGYLVADPKVIQAIELVRLPYHLSSLTQAAARAALANRGALQVDVKRLSESRDQLAKALSDMGLTVYASDANFILFGGFNESAEKLWRDLLDKGVLIRDVGLAGKLRVTIGTEEENRAFLVALRQSVRG
jgi:histidinol-phosphate aminotransferase